MCFAYELSFVHMWSIIFLLTLFISNHNTDTGSMKCVCVCMCVYECMYVYVCTFFFFNKDLRMNIPKVLILSPVGLILLTCYVYL